MADMGKTVPCCKIETYSMWGCKGTNLLHPSEPLRTILTKQDHKTDWHTDWQMDGRKSISRTAGDGSVAEAPLPLSVQQ